MGLVLHPEVTLCDWQDVIVQLLSHTQQCECTHKQHYSTVTLTHNNVNAYLYTNNNEFTHTQPLTTCKEFWLLFYLILFSIYVHVLLHVYTCLNYPHKNIKMLVKMKLTGAMMTITQK